jgi:acetyl-CoA C-acetyltransferase
MAIDPQSPVIVGVAQSKRRPSPTDDLENLPEPAEMMAEVAALAVQDSGSDRILSKVTSIRVMGLLSWGYMNPGALVAQRLGIDVKESVLTTTGGNSPQMLVNDAGRRIAKGELDAAIVVGAEAVLTRMLQSRANPPVHVKWTRRDEETAGPPTMMGEETQGNNPAEMSIGLAVPIQVYPLFENALRASLGRPLEEHRMAVARLWSRFSEVAATNPYAWSQEVRSAEEIATVSPDNRMVCYPYTKLMNANIQTDQAAALIICSVEAARSAGIPPERWVFLHSGAEAHDHWFLSERDNLYSSPAIRETGGAALDAAGMTIDDVAHFDLYSCFPSAVQVAAAALGVPVDDPARPLTVTGGLGFAGGPGNNYVTHSIAAMVEVLRRDPGSFGLVSAVGWYLTKHAIGVYSTTPPKARFDPVNVQARIDALPKRSLAEGDEADGPATLETYTVVYDRSGSPERALMACLKPDGRRAWAVSTDPETMERLTTEEMIGKPLNIANQVATLG